LSLGGNFYQKFEIFAIFSYLSPHFYTDNVKILLKRTEDLGIHQRHKISSESLKGPAGVALPRGGDAYCFLVVIVLTHQQQHVAVLVDASWGPKDDGRTVDGPQHVTVDGMRHGVEFGRRGYGSIYVVASGNGGVVGDNCNYDGYANTIYTVTIGAVGEDGAMPFYGEECASMLAVTFSSSTYHRSIVSY